MKLKVDEISKAQTRLSTYFGHLLFIIFTKNMKSLNFSSDDGIFSGKITVVVKNKTMLKKLIDNLKKINGIDKVSRV